jgi:hypothetical protein
VFKNDAAQPVSKEGQKMLLIVISTGILFVGVTALVVWAQLNTGRSQSMEDALLEGATLSKIPSLDRLLSDPQARNEIKEHVVELGFNSCADVGQTRNAEYQTAEVFLIDDGGGVHVLEQVTANTMSGVPIAELEAKALELAKLLGVALRT